MMRKYEDEMGIILASHALAIVSASDYDRISAFMWRSHPRGYAQCDLPGGGGTVTMHRMVMAAPTGSEVDHINGDKLDNRRENLRFVTRSQQIANCRSHEGSTSRFKGVSRPKGRRKWIAQISCKGRYHYLGWFDTEEGAACSYNEAAKRLFGEFARLNDIPEGPAR